MPFFTDGVNYSLSLEELLAIKPKAKRKYTREKKVGVENESA